MGRAIKIRMKNPNEGILVQTNDSLCYAVWKILVRFWNLPFKVYWKSKVGSLESGSYLYNTRSPSGSSCSTPRGRAGPLVLSDPIIPIGSYRVDHTKLRFASKSRTNECRIRTLMILHNCPGWLSSSSVEPQLDVQFSCNNWNNKATHFLESSLRCVR